MDLYAREWSVPLVMEQYFAIYSLLYNDLLITNSLIACYINNILSFNCISLLGESIQILDNQRISWINDFQQKYKVLIQEYHQIINVCTNSLLKRKLSSELIECMAELGHIYYLNADYRTAKKQYEQTMRRAPEYIAVLSQLAMCCVKDKEYDEASMLFKLCCDRSYRLIDKVDSLLNLAWLYQLQKKDVSLVAEILSKAKKLSPNNPDVISEEKRLRSFVTSTRKAAERFLSFKSVQPQKHESINMDLLLADQQTLNSSKIHLI